MTELMIFIIFIAIFCWTKTANVFVSLDPFVNKQKERGEGEGERVGRSRLSRLFEVLIRNPFLQKFK